jgi:SAM-dependent methyltransferase
MNDSSDPPAATVHRAAASGYATGVDNYAKGRPEYPQALREWLPATVGIGPGTTVVDLGAGTGKFTRLLVATEASVIAVEPVAEMLARLETDVPQARAMRGTATAIPLPDAAVDAVVCAQAFHWFASAEALAEIVRVLRPGGRLALVWNLRDAHVPWVARLDAIVDRYEGDVPRFYKGTWRAAFPQPALTELRESQFTHLHTGAPDDVIVRRVLSMSFISALPVEERNQVEARLRALIAAEPELRGHATVAVPYRTFAYCCSRRIDGGSAPASA